jgi:cysteine desulfurase
MTIYLDPNATTPIAPEVVGAMRPYLERQFGNPSSSHEPGATAAAALAAGTLLEGVSA